MTKALVQGRIGYYKDGKLVYMPQQRHSPEATALKASVKSISVSSSSSSSSVPAHVLRNKERKAQLQQERLLQKKKNQVKAKNTASIDQVSSSVKLKQSKKNQTNASISHKAFVLPESIKNASKKGVVGTALKALAETSQELKQHTSISLSYFSILCRLLFLPDLEQRSALYYAALTGHAHLVELYLSLYVMCAMSISINISSSSNVHASNTNLTTSMTFQQWLEQYGTRSLCLGKQFSKNEYQVIVLNALNDQVKHILVHKKITIHSAMDFVMSSIEIYGRNDANSRRNMNLNWLVECVETKRIELLEKMDKCQKMLLNNKEEKKNKKNRKSGGNGGGNGSRKPKLVCEDLYEYDDYTADLMDDEAAYDDEYGYDEEYDEYDYGHDYDESYEDDDEEEEEGVSTTSAASSDDSSQGSNLEYHEQQLAELEQLVKSQDFSVALEEEDVDVDVDDEEEDNDDEEEAFLSSNEDVIIDGLHVVSDDDLGTGTGTGPFEDGWDLVSEVDSVKSIDSTFAKPSYKEMLLQPCDLVFVDKNTIPIHPPTCTPPKSSDSSNPASSSSETDSDKEDREDDETQQTLTFCEDERDGVKLARGGKTAKMFKGEGKRSRPKKKVLQQHHQQQQHQRSRHIKQ